MATTLPPSFATIVDNARIIMAVEAADYHRDHYAKNKDKYRAGISQMIELPPLFFPRHFGRLEARQQ